MGERNARLRAARERLVSRRLPGEHPCRAELAELVNAWLWEHTGRRFDLDDHLIGKWERGTVRNPIAPYRAALRAVLGVDTDAELGFVQSTRSATPTAVTAATTEGWTLVAIADEAARVTESELINRRDALLGAAAFSGAALVDPLARWVEPLAAGYVARTPPTSTVPSGRSGAFSVVEVEALERLVTTFREWRAVGSGLGRTAVVGQLVDVSDRLRSAPSGPLTDRVFVVGAELAKIAGSMAFDVGAHGPAQRHYVTAARMAKAGGNTSFGAVALAALARQSFDLGAADDGLQVVQLAQRGTRRTATPRLRALLATREAWAHAHLGDVRRFRHAAELAEVAHSDSEPASEPRWLQTLDAAELIGTIGARYRDLAQHDPRQAPDAVEYLSRALTMREPARARNRAFDLVSLGRAHLITREPDRSAAVVESALTHVDRQRPGRLHRKLGEWHDEAARFAVVPAVALVRDRVRDITAAGAATA